MLKKTLAASAAVFVAFTAAASAEYNKYNEESYVNLSNKTLGEVAAVYQMTADEFKTQFGLPADMPEDTNEAAAFYHMTVDNYAKYVDRSVDEVIEEISSKSDGAAVSKDESFAEAESNMLLVKYFEPMTIEEIKKEYGFGDEINENTRYGEVRNDFYKKMIERLEILSYFNQDSILVMLNGRYMDFDVAPVIINDRTMVPMRAIFEALGADVQWDGDTKTIMATHGADVITMQVGRNEMFLNDAKIELDTPSSIVDGRTLVPLRAVSEALNAKVSYNTDTKTVVIH